MIKYVEQEEYNELKRIEKEHVIMKKRYENSEIEKEYLRAEIEKLNEIIKENKMEGLIK